MSQPRQHHYHFAYSVLPSDLFLVDIASILLSRYHEGFLWRLKDLWERMGKQFPIEERVSAESMNLSAHRIGNLHPVILIQMPTPERDLETYFLALVWTPELRYFTLGRAPTLPGPEEFPSSTLREVSPRGNARIGSIHGPAPTGNQLLERLCDLFGLPVQVEAMSEIEVRALAEQVPIYPSPGPIRLEQTAPRFAPEDSSGRGAPRQNPTGQRATHKSCPQCGKHLSLYAVKCRYCQNKLSENA